MGIGWYMFNTLDRAVSSSIRGAQRSHRQAVAQRNRQIAAQQRSEFNYRVSELRLFCKAADVSIKRVDSEWCVIDLHNGQGPKTISWQYAFDIASQIQGNVVHEFAKLGIPAQVTGLNEYLVSVPGHQPTKMDHITAIRYWVEVEDARS